MTDGAALLHAICCDPMDDMLRLVYADWLEEHGDPDRAEFVRVQIERSKLPERDVEHWTTPARASDCPPGTGLLCTSKLVCGGPNCRLLAGDAIHLSGCRWDALRKREADLLGAHGPDWQEEFALSIGDRSHAYYAVDPTFRHGFVETVTGSFHDWQKHGAAIVRTHPILKVILTDVAIASHDPLGSLPDWLVRRTQSAFQDWCVAFAREQAGLPPLAALASAR